jgi:hypothetical protein
MRSLARLAGVLVGACAVSAALPAFAEVALRIDCPTLDAAANALLEARGRAELASEASAGSLAIDCAGASARLVWQPEDAPPRERIVALDPDPASAVDNLLDAIHALASTVSPPPPAPAPSVSSFPEPSEAPPDAPAKPRDSFRFGVLVGADSELWQGGISAALGPHAGGRMLLGRRWHVALIAGPAWGLGSTLGLRAWRLRGVARLEYAPVSQLQLGMGVSGRVLWAEATSGDIPSERTGASSGLVFSARYVLAGGPIAISAGPDFEALAHPISVDVAGAEAFRVPTFVFGLSVDAGVR